MSKDHHGNFLQEGLQIVEQQPQQQEEKEEQGLEKDREKEEEEGVVATRKDAEEEECKTPTSSNHRIPTIRSCPPTPRKKATVNFHKRKFSELQFFETTRSEEVESFFRSISTVEIQSIKRRCSSA